MGQISQTVQAVPRKPEHSSEKLQTLIPDFVFIDTPKIISKAGELLTTCLKYEVWTRSKIMLNHRIVGGKEWSKNKIKDPSTTLERCQNEQSVANSYSHKNWVLNQQTNQSHDKGRVLHRFTKNMPLRNSHTTRTNIQLSSKSMEAESSASLKLSHYNFGYFVVLLWKKLLVR